MKTEHMPEDSRQPPAEVDHRLLHANEQLTLKALQSQEQAEASEQRYLDQNEVNKMLVQKQHQLRYLASELILTEQRQRKSLALELHDYLAQMMVLGRLKIGNIRSRLVACDPVSIRMIGEIDEIFIRSLAYTRTLMAELCPPVLYELGLSSALKWLAEDMKKFGLQVEVHVPHDPVPLPDDQRVLLYQSVRELLLNVVKHATVSQVSLSLSVEGHENRLHIVVRDEGSGFDTASMEAKPEGAHFGLFSIRERMAAMGGHFQLDTASGQGTSVRLTLSLKSAEGPAPVQRSMITRDRPHVHPTPKSPKVHRVLLVDDHALIRQGLRTILDDHDDMTVIGEAGNGAEAVSMASDMRPDIILMDINMPKMNGIEATKQIKATQPETIVIGLSVNTSTQIIEAMKLAGAAAFVSKEAASDELHDTLAALISIDPVPIQ